MEDSEDSVKTMLDPCLSTSDVALGLSSTLETYVQLTSDARETFQGLVSEMNGTASALTELWRIIVSDEIAAKEQERARGLTQAGLDEVSRLDAKCRKIYGIIIALIQKAAHTGPNPYEPPTTIDPRTVLRSVTSLRRLDWDWLWPRVLRCQQQLKWLKIMLLVDIQVAQLALLHLGTSNPRPTGTFDRELGLRASAELLWERQVNITRRIAKQRMKAREPSVGRTVTTTTPSTRSLCSSSVESLDVKDTESCLPPAMATAPTPQPFPPLTKIEEENEGSVCSTAVEELDKSIPSSAFPSKVEPKAASLMGQDLKVGEPTTLVDDSKDTTIPAEPELPDLPEHAPEPTKPEDDPKSVSKDTGIDLLSSGPFSSRFPNFLGRWCNTIFSRRNSNPLAEVKSQELEAWVFQPGPTDPIRIPFGHQRLKQGMKRVLSKNGTEPWNAYINFTPEQRAMVDDVTKFANNTTDHIRTCIAFDQVKKDGQFPSYIVFFSLKTSERPLKFKDAVGRKYTFPFALCNNWDGINDLIKKAFIDMDVIGPHVQAGHFDLLNESGTIILPECWNSTARPGMSITMHMWPVGKLPGVPGPFPHPRPAGPPAWCAPPPPPGPRPGMAIPINPITGLAVYPPPPRPRIAIPIDPRTGLPLNPPPPQPAPTAFSAFAAPLPRPHLPPLPSNSCVQPPQARPNKAVMTWMTGGNGGISSSRASSSSSASTKSSTSDDKNEITQEEEMQLEVVDFISMYGANRDGGDKFDRFLSNMTNMTDVAPIVVGRDCLGKMWYDSESEDGSVSDGSDSECGSDWLL